MSLVDLYDPVYYICLGLMALPLGIGLYYRARLRQAHWLVWWLLLGLLLTEITANWLRYQMIRNHFMNYAYTLAVLWPGVWFYRSIMGWRWPLWAASAITLLLPIEVWGWVGFNHINSTTLSLSLLLLAVCAFRSLGLVIDRSEGASLRRNPDFFLHLGFLVFSFLPAFTSLFKSYFIETSQDLYFFTDVMGLFMAGLAYALFAIGLYLSASRTSALPAVSVRT